MLGHFTAGGSNGSGDMRASTGPETVHRLHEQSGGMGAPAAGPFLARAVEVQLMALQHFPMGTWDFPLPFLASSPSRQLLLQAV